MRLSNRIRSVILKSINDSFGDMDCYLFGSRVDDTKRGGDIDLAIDTSLNGLKFRKNKIKFIASMMKLGYGDLKMDLVNYNTTDELLYSEIQSNSIRIN